MQALAHVVIKWYEPGVKLCDIVYIMSDNVLLQDIMDILQKINNGIHETSSVTFWGWIWMQKAHMVVWYWLIKYTY